IWIEFDRLLRPIVLQALGYQALHAAAALTPGGALLICGQSGAGKSTTAFALGQLGFDQLADDQVVWRIDNGRPVVHPLRFSPRLRPRARAHLGSSEPRRASAWSRSVSPSIAAVYLLNQGETVDGGVSVRRLPADEAFRELLPH